MGTQRAKADATNAAARFVGALLCVAVAAIHVIDQGGIPGSKTPTYVGIGYWILEIAAVLTAITLLAKPGARAPWFVAIGVGAGPLIGYVLSRGPGLPDYSDDIGNWLEPLGVLSLGVEAILIVLALIAFIRRPGTRPGAPAPLTSDAPGGP
jgi:hypothetical protein